jgi:hypothetical protein
VLAAALAGSALYAQAPAADIGTASGLLRSFGYIGSIASSAIIAIVFRTYVSDHVLPVMAVIMIAVSTVALLLTLAGRKLISLASIGRDPSARPAGPGRRAGAGKDELNRRHPGRPAAR